MRAVLFLVPALLITVVTGSASASCTDSHAEYSLMNAMNDRIWVDIDSTLNHDWRDVPLDPSQSAAFDGHLMRVKVRLRSGRVVEYRKREITAIRARSRVQKGDWIIDRSGLRFVSCRERQELFETVQKSLATSPNQVLQPAAAPLCFSASLDRS